jgi:hypothetical protein
MKEYEDFVAKRVAKFLKTDSNGAGFRAAVSQRISIVPFTSVVHFSNG